MSADSALFDDGDDVELSAAFARLRGVRADPPSGLDERCLDGVEAAITAQDLAELGTAVLVTEFLGPVLDLLAFVLGFEEPGRGRGVDRARHP